VEGASFTFYFAEDELETIKETALEEEKFNKTDESLPFDGMSCVAFKTNQLQLDKTTRKIASFDPDSSGDVDAVSSASS